MFGNDFSFGNKTSGDLLFGDELFCSNGKVPTIVSVHIQLPLF